MSGLLVVIRLILCLVLAIAGIAKLGDRAGTRQALLGFGVPPWLTPTLATLLPSVELGAGLALLPVPTAWWGSVAALALLVLFLAAIGYNLARGRRPDCHCFGQLHSAPIGSPTVVRNLVLATLALILVLQPGRDPGPGLLSLTAGATPALITAIAMGVLALVGTAFNGWLLSNLLRQNGRLLLRLDTLEETLRAPGQADEAADGRLASASDAAVGALAPAFTLPSLGGEPVSLDLLSSAGKPVMLVFVDPNCGPCTALLPEVAGWQRDHAERFTVAVVTRGTAERNAKKISRSGVQGVLLQAGQEISERYGTLATPSAVVVDAAGRIASPVASGSEGIRRLVTRFSHPPAIESRGVARMGTQAPPLSLPDLDGASFDLTDHLGRDKVLLFWNPGCGYCQRLLPDLQVWAAGHPAAAADLVLVSTPDREANSRSGLPGPILLDDGFATGQAFGAGGTPTAVLVDATGRIGAAPAVGGQAVLALLTRLSPREGRVAVAATARE